MELTSPPYISASLLSSNAQESGGETRIEGRFQVGCTATDDSGIAPQTSAVMVVPNLSNPTLLFVQRALKRIRINLASNQIEVQAPDPAALWSAVQSAGGIAVTDGQVFNLEQNTGATQFDYKYAGNGTLDGIAGPSVRLRCSAVDAEGNAASVEVGPGESSLPSAQPRQASASGEMINGTAGQIPSDFALAPNYPNPFNPTTRLTFDVPEASDVQLEVFDMLGRRVRTLVNGRVEAGRHEVEFTGEALPSGTYIARLVTAQGRQTQTMILVK